MTYFDLVKDLAYRPFPLALENMENIKSSERKVIRCLHNMFIKNKDGAIPIALRFLEQECKLSNRSVRNALQMWKKHGIIDWRNLNGTNSVFVSYGIPPEIIEKHASEVLVKKSKFFGLQKGL